MKTKLIAGVFMLINSLAFFAKATTLPNYKIGSYQQVKYKTVKVDGLEVFYREAGDPAKPTILLLHGFPSTSHMYRDLITDLSANYHLIAPDYPGFGFSSRPAADRFNYTFDHLALIIEHFVDAVKLKKFGIYMQDYGGPIGFRLATKRPELVSALIIQNANAYADGLGDGFKGILALQDAGKKDEVAKIFTQIISYEGTKEQYVTGTKNLTYLNPDSYETDFNLINRPGSKAIQEVLFQDYHNNLAKYPAWHQYLQNHQPLVLIVWGKNDPIFTAPGALAYKKDLKSAEVHLLNAGHFALEEYHSEIARYIRTFLKGRGIK